MDFLFLIYLFLPVMMLVFGYWFGYTRGENEGYMFGKEVGRYEERASNVIYFRPDQDDGGYEQA